MPFKLKPMSISFLFASSTFCMCRSNLAAEETGKESLLLRHRAMSMTLLATRGQCGHASSMKPILIFGISSIPINKRECWVPKIKGVLLSCYGDFFSSKCSLYWKRSNFRWRIYMLLRLTWQSFNFIGSICSNIKKCYNKYNLKH